MLTAITRAVSPTLGDCQLEHLDRQPIDVDKAIAQHCAYEQCLSDLGVTVVSLPAAADCPDGVFVEDPALVLDEVAIVTRMGAESRRRESESLAKAVAQYREVKRLTDPATLEGGDVMRIGKTLYVGWSKRTNRAGIDQLGELVAPYGYRVVAVDVSGCLHLKSACCYLGGDRILANREWFDHSALKGFNILDVPPDEARGANVLRIGDAVLIPAVFKWTAEVLNAQGFHPRLVDTTELMKAEAGVTCMSLLFDTPDQAPLPLP
jgi:dimethylargininase